MRMKSITDHELLNMRPSDVEPNGIINITNAKGGKQRRVHLDSDTLAMLSEYVSALQLPDDLPVFASNNPGTQHR